MTPEAAESEHEAGRATRASAGHAVARAPADERDRRRVLALLERHGFNATSFQTLEPEFTYWFDDEADACVAYVDTGGAWVVAGAPIAPLERMAEVASRFQQAATHAHRRVAYFGTEERFARAVPSVSVLVGEQPVWDPSRWASILEATRSLREQLRRARAKGVVVRAASAAELSDPASPTRRAIEQLVRRWLGSRRMAPMGFLVQLEPFVFPEERRYFVAEQRGAVVGFLGVVPVYARDGWFLEDLLRDPAAPNGTAELLVDAAMRAAADDGSRYATLGIAPLSGAVSGPLRAARRWTARLYDFEGLRAFKAKLRPNAWEPIYLSFPKTGKGALALYDTLAAFARGGLLRFGLATLLRGPAIVFELLAYLLVPWTVLLAVAPARAWFPSPWVKWAWVAFDVCIAPSLLVLSRRFRRDRAAVLASLVTADAVLTAIQAATWNLPRARGPLEVVVSVVAMLAPTVAAILLWSARSHAHPHRPARG